MNLSSQLNPIQIKRGFIAVSIVDWSQVGNNQAVYDFNAANVTKSFRQVAGLWCDNTNNTNSITVTVGGSNQIFKVYGGEQATFPIFTTDYPRITAVNNNDVTPGIGSSQIIFTDFDIGFNIAQTGSGSSIVVSDTNLAAILAGTAGGTVNGVTTMLSVSAGLTNSRALLVRTGFSRVAAVSVSQISLVAGSQTIIPFNTATSSWWIQNVSANPMYIMFAGGAPVAASATNGSYMLSAGATLTSSAFSVFEGGSITICPTAAGDKVNVYYK